MNPHDLSSQISIESFYRNEFEPAHDKTYKMSCAPGEDSDQPGHAPSLISLRYPHEEFLDP